MTPIWQKRRCEFNHDWIKNKYLQALFDWRSLLNDEQEDVELEKTFVSDVLPQWESHEKEALNLPKDFEIEMSPKVLFKEPPLSRFDEDTKNWLGELIHELWLVRCSVKSLIADAENKAENTKQAYKKLQEALKTCADTKSVELLRPLKPLFDEFCACCEALAKSIEKFPGEIKVF